MTTRQALVLYGFGAWTIWVWGTRIWNVFDADNSTAFIAVHVTLALVSVVLAIASIVVVRQVRRGGGAGPQASSGPGGVAEPSGSLR